MIFSNLGAMKGRGFDDGKDFFSKFQLQQQQQQQQQFRQISLTQNRECNSEDVEVDSRSTGEEEPTPTIPAPSPSNNKKQKKAGTYGDEASIEVVRRPRGRPPGSKNKPKPPVIVTRDAAESTNDTMRPYVLEIPAGHDVGDALARFSRRRELGLSVLSGVGSVSNVTLRQPSLLSSTPSAAVGSAVTLHGRFEILSISATFFPSSSSGPPASLPSNAGLSVSLAGPQGRIVGGSVSGPLVAAGTVTIVAATFTNPSFHRLPLEEDESISVSGDGARSGDVDTQHHHRHQQQQHHQLQQHQQNHPHPRAAAMPETSAMSIYGGHHISSDVIWAPTARAPQPPPF